MNFLAHLHLAEHSRTSPLGNLLGDFVKGPLAGDLAPELLLGIRLHRAIDRFTDTHAEHKAACTLFPAPWRRFAPVVVDMLYDHWLSRHWARFSPRPLGDFLDTHYQALLAARPYHAEHLPHGLPLALRRMAEQRWLESYASREGIAMALDGIGRRLHRPLPLSAALAPLGEEEWQHIELGFLRFYPQLLAHTEQTGQALRQEMMAAQMHGQRG